MRADREFYEKEYHYAEDVDTGIDAKRLVLFFKGVRFSDARSYLDIGCGVGWALHYCFKKGLPGVGFDISERACRAAKKILDPMIQVLVADGEKLPLKSNRFDLAASLGTIEHFPSPARGLDEINRVLTRRGQAVFVVPNSYWVLNKLRLYKGTEQPQEMLATIGEWARFFQRHHFQVVSISRDIGPKVLKNKKPLGMIKRLLLKATLTLPREFAYQFIITCRKK